MPSFNVEIIASGPESEKQISLKCHVNKYTESFAYAKDIGATNAPISYHECDQVDSWENIKITDLTYVIPTNNTDVTLGSHNWHKINRATFSSPYRDVLLTHQSSYSRYGKVLPLFYKHVLPENTIQAEVVVIQNGEKASVGEGLKVVIEENAIYTNCENYYNKDTGGYRLYYVASTDANGNSSQEILNLIPAINEATYADVDLDPTSPTYGQAIGLSWSRVDGDSSGAFTYVINNGGSTITQKKCESNAEGQESAFYMQPLQTSAIKLELPSGRNPEDPWNIKITNGYFWNENKKYWVPEYNKQPFNPSKPFIYSSYRDAVWVNANTLSTTRSSLGISPSDYRHISVYVENSDQEVVSAYTTDPELIGKRYSNTSVFYEDQIICWDNKNGFITLGLEVDSSKSFYCSYFFKAKEYEYAQLSLNPIQNIKALDTTFVFYVIPDANEQEKSIHFIGVNRKGKIVSASQSGQSGYNFGLTNEDGSYNTNTIIGKDYQSNNPECFKNKYCVPYKNAHQFYILGEVYVSDIGDKEDLLSLSITEKGESIKADSFKQAVRRNPRVLHSSYGLGPEGQLYPENNVSWVRAPITLLEEFGGHLTKDNAETILKTYSPAGNYNIIDWEYNNCDLNGYSTNAQEVALKMSWEGTGLTYNIYRKQTTTEAWGEPLISLQVGAREEVAYLDQADLSSGLVYHYGVKIVENGIEFPFGNILSVMVK